MSNGATPSALRAPEPWTTPLDAARAAVLRAFARPGRRFFGDRAARVALYGAVGVLSALAATLAAPLWLLAYGPIVLGVPHVLADARYLVARPKLHTRASFWLLVAAPLGLALLVPRASTALVAVAGGALAARGGDARKVAVLALVTGGAALAIAHPRVADVAMAHAHNLVAIALWVAWIPRGTKLGWRAIPLALFALACALLLSGAFDSALAHPFATRGLSLREATRTLAPFAHVADSGAWGARFVLFFAFAQSVHYAVWLRLVPEEDRPRAGIRSFAATWRALADDLGWVLPAACALATVALVAWAVVDPRVARLTYLRVAFFHGPLEIAIAALLFVEGRAPRAAR